MAVDTIAPGSERVVVRRDLEAPLGRSGLPRLAAGPPASLLVIGWGLTGDRHADPHYYWTIATMALAALMLARPFARRDMARRFALALALLFVGWLVVSTADRALASWEERSPEFGAISWASSTVLNLFGYHTTVVRGLLLVDHPDGVISVAATPEKLALRPFLLFWAAWMTLRLGRPGNRWISGIFVVLATTLVIGILRYIVLLALYVEHDKILMGIEGQAALDLFGLTWVTGLSLLAAGWVSDRVAVPAGREHEIGRPSRQMVLPVAGRGAAMLAAGAFVGLALTLSIQGSSKGGRVLIDDRFCGIWEPTARLLDEEWYGDFSTYSFTSLAEWLGKWFRVDVNTTRAYDDALLAGYDVLVLKTPERPIPGEEASAIERFVQGGGGLLLVGDHTNLLGMGTHLNSLSARYGIRFRYDSVSDGPTGGFVTCENPAFGRHVGSLHVDKIEFMTSCSLLISGAAEAVLAAENCRREPHDYASSSFFGRRGPHPEMGHGRTVLAATVRVGRGRIAAFTDSTVWSSFAIFSWDRDKLAMDLVRLLDRSVGRFEALRLSALAFAVAFCSLLGLGMARTGLPVLALACGLTGYWGGLAASDALHRFAYPLRGPNAPVDEVRFLWVGGACAYPPVLGTPTSLEPGRCFDTLMVTVQRLGLVPRIAYTYGDDLLGPDARSLFVVAPVDSPPPRRCLASGSSSRAAAPWSSSMTWASARAAAPRHSSGPSMSGSNTTEERKMGLHKSLTSTSAGRWCRWTSSRPSFSGRRNPSAGDGSSISRTPSISRGNGWVTASHAPGNPPESDTKRFF